MTEVVGEALGRQVVSFEGPCGSSQSSPVELTYLDFCTEMLVCPASLSGRSEGQLSLSSHPEELARG